MSRNSKIDSPTQEVVTIVNQLGLKAAAKHYNMNPSNLYRWLKKQGYRSKHQYVKESQTQHKYQTA